MKKQLLSTYILNIYNNSSNNPSNNKYYILYNIHSLNYNGIISGNVNKVTNNLKNMINSKIIDKYHDYNYYIQEDYNDNIPSLFSNSNSVNCVVPNILHNIAKYNKKNITLKIRFYPKSKNYNFFDNKKNITITIEINNLNYRYKHLKIV
jgi:hypothetical protein